MGGIKTKKQMSETEGMSGLYYLGRVCVNGALKSISAIGEVNFNAPFDGQIDTMTKRGRFALFIIRNEVVYQRFRLGRNLTNKDELRGQDDRKIDVKESDDILVFIYKTCEQNPSGNVLFCPWQVNVPANHNTLYYSGSDFMATNLSNREFSMKVIDHFHKDTTIPTKIHLNVEVTITGNNFITYYKCIMLGNL